MSIETDFPRHGHELVDWMAQYLADIERVPVRAQVAPGEILDRLATVAPERGEPIEQILRDARETLLPGITHWQHPGFLAYFAISATTPGILADMFAAALNVNGMLWATSPAATELEQRTVLWLAQLLGVPLHWFGQLTDTASTSTLLALAAAREGVGDGVRDAAIDGATGKRYGSLDVRARGLAGRNDVPRLRVYCSELAHSSVDKAVMTLGIGHENLVKVPVDAEFRMRTDALADTIARDRAAGFLPIAVVATAGTTGVASVDPVRAIAQVCRREGIWLHVDAAYAGAAAIVPELRWVLDGVELADSIVVNPHKWLVTPVGCSALWVRDVNTLRRTFTIVPEYLRTNAGDVLDYHDVGFQLGRPFRALKLWMVLRAYGAEGLRAIIREHCALAQRFAALVDSAPGWCVAAPVRFSLVCVRYEPHGLSADDADAANLKILETVNREGRVLLSHTKVAGRVVLRVAIGNARTTQRDLDAAWDALQRAAAT